MTSVKKRWFITLIVAGSLLTATQAGLANPGLLLAKKSDDKAAAQTKAGASKDGGKSESKAAAQPKAGGTADTVKADASKSAGKPLSVKLISVNSPVHPGDDLTINVQTAPKSQCEIIVKNKSGKSTAKGLEPKEANNTGKVSWTWKVAKNVKPGTINVTCNCTWGEKKGSLDTTVDVQK